MDRRRTGQDIKDADIGSDTYTDADIDIDADKDKDKDWPRGARTHRGQTDGTRGGDTPNYIQSN